MTTCAATWTTGVAFAAREGYADPVRTYECWLQVGHAGRHHSVNGASWSDEALGAASDRGGACVVCGGALELAARFAARPWWRRLLGLERAREIWTCPAWWTPGTSPPSSRDAEHLWRSRVTVTR